MILGFLGQPRSGKTLLMTWWLKRFFDAGYTVVSNYSLSFEHRPFQIEVVEKTISDEGFQKQWKNLREYYNAERLIIAIDEITSLMDSRAAMKKENLLLGYLLMQAGKTKTNVIWTAQLPHSVDKRLRDLTEFITFAEKAKNEAGQTVGFSYRQIDMYHMTSRQWFLSEEEARKIYGLYDTEEPIRQQTLKKKKEA